MRKVLLAKNNSQLVEIVSRRRVVTRITAQLRKTHEFLMFSRVAKKRRRTSKFGSQPLDTPLWMVLIRRSIRVELW
jgi:hypothetical protein